MQTAMMSRARAVSVQAKKSTAKKAPSKVSSSLAELSRQTAAQAEQGGVETGATTDRDCLRCSDLHFAPPKCRLTVACSPPLNPPVKQKAAAKSAPSKGIEWYGPNRPTFLGEHQQGFVPLGHLWPPKPACRLIVRQCT